MSWSFVLFLVVIILKIELRLFRVRILFDHVIKFREFFVLLPRLILFIVFGNTQRFLVNELASIRDGKSISNVDARPHWLRRIFLQGLLRRKLGLTLLSLSDHPGLLFVGL